MNISRRELTDAFDANFIKVLKKVYITRERVNKTGLAESIHGLLSENNYSPSIPKFIIDYDKGHGVSRPVPVFDPIDYGVFYYCIKQLEENIALNRVEGTFGGWSLGGKIRHMEDEDSSVEDIDYPMTASLTPEAWARYYGDFNSKIVEYARSLPPDEYVAVELDIANFYDTIRLDILESKIRLVSKKEKSTVINLLFHFLRNSNKQIHSFQAQSTGIPQDMIADCSRLLANFYLQDYDLAVKQYADKHDVKYLRYADDQILFIPKGMNYKEAVKYCSNSLYKLGLNINQKKVKKFDLDDLLKYRSISTFEILDPELPNRAQPENIAIKFAQESIRLIMSEGSLKNNGASLLRKVIAIGLDKLPHDLMLQVFSLVISEEYLPFLDHVKLSQIYQAVNDEGKFVLLAALEREAQLTTQSAFFYECHKFSKKHGLGLDYFKKKIKEYNKTWTTA